MLQEDVPEFKFEINVNGKAMTRLCARYGMTEVDMAFVMVQVAHTLLDNAIERSKPDARITSLPTGQFTIHGEVRT